MAIGQLNGTMSETTPMGRRSTVVWNDSGACGSGLPSSVRGSVSRSASPAARWKRAARTWMSRPDSNTVLPFSRESSRARSSCVGARGSRAARISSARSCGVSAAHAGNAARAARTAARASSGVAFAAWPMMALASAGS